MAVKLLQRRTIDVELVDRTFRLSEFSFAELRQYLEKRVQLLDPARVKPGLWKRLKLWIMRTLRRPAPKEDFMATFDAWAARLDAFLAELLREPVDGGGPIGPAWVRENLTASMRRELIAVVDEFNSIGGVAQEVNAVQAVQGAA